MREDAIWRKTESGLLQEIQGRSWLAERLSEIISEGEQGLDRLSLELVRMVAK